MKWFFALGFLGLLLAGCTSPTPSTNVAPPAPVAKADDPSADSCRLLEKRLLSQLREVDRTTAMTQLRTAKSEAEVVLLDNTSTVVQRRDALDRFWAAVRKHVSLSE